MRIVAFSIAALIAAVVGLTAGAHLAQADPGQGIGDCQRIAAQNAAPAVPAGPGQFGVCLLPTRP